MIAKQAGLALVTATLLASSAAMAIEGNTPVSSGAVPPLDHVFFIMMENHAYGQIVGNPNAPFINKYLAEANHATNYFGVAHPSLTNYLETTGGSNFGVLSDNSPDWHNTACVPNIVAGTQNRDDNGAGAICPIAGTGVDAPTVAIDTTNETSPPQVTAVCNLDCTLSLPSASTTGKTIADQLVAHHKSWRTYQESLPPGGADRVNNSNGNFTDTTNFVTLFAPTAPLSGQTGGSVVALYASKHNPFVYFQSVQQGADPRNSLANVRAFDGWNGLYADLATGQVPHYSYIVPNQCNDQHGKSAGSVGPFCQYDPNDNGTQVGLNPALIYQGDQAIEKIVSAIKHSPAWEWGNNAIVVVWDENDYSAKPIPNKVLAIVDTNYAPGGRTSATFYTHFSVLKTLQAGFGLPCLNHTCDADTAVMSDLFGRARY